MLLCSPWKAKMALPPYQLINLKPLAKGAVVTTGLHASVGEEGPGQLEAT